MTIAEILEQAKTLTSQERKELVKLLVDTFDATQPTTAPPNIHWGQALNRLLDELEPIEMKYPDIDDPVEWVNHLRSAQRKHRLSEDENT